MEREHQPTQPSTESLVDYAALFAEAKGSEQETPAEVKEVANFEGNWMNLQHERMQSEDFRAKFESFRSGHIDSLKAGEPKGIFDKPKQFRAHYEAQLANFDANLDKVYSSVGYEEAPSHKAKTLGRNTIGETGIVYSNGELNGIALEGRHKDIIAAHEAYHGIIDTEGSDAEEVRGGFDFEQHDELVAAMAAAGQEVAPNYLYDARELTARMAQLKNYYGMKAAEPFTKHHLDYARQHYVADTGLDNSMGLFMDSVTARTEPEFLRLMNELPI